jgi:hypothetical protein
MRVCCVHAAVAILVLLCGQWARGDSYPELILQDRPVAYWQFDDVSRGEVTSAVAGELSGESGHLSGQLVGAVRTERAGPRPTEYPDFGPRNRCATLPDGAHYIRVSDPGAGSPLDFTSGDALTLEAWVRWDGRLKGSYPYLIGKGRTHRDGTPRDNQNYSLRLAPQADGVMLSFFFCDEATPVDAGADGGRKIGAQGHRWTSTVGIPQDGGWHHVAVTYTFGSPTSLRGYVDGAAVPGRWDMGGETDKPPVVDDDELWIGSAMAGRSTFVGDIDEVAIYRYALSPEQIGRHVRLDLPEATELIGRIDPRRVPDDRVRVEIMEGVPVARKWEFRPRPLAHLFDTEYFAMKDLPRRYNARGLIDDRAIPVLLHLSSRIELPAGEYEFLLRSLDAARLYVDGQLVAHTEFMNLKSDAHQAYYGGLDRGPDILSLAEGHQEVRGRVTLEGSTHVVSLYRLLGNAKHGSYLGELALAVAPQGGEFRFVSPTRELPYTDAGWLDFLDWERQYLTAVNAEQRRRLSATEDDYWNARHAYARSHAGPEIVPPAVRDPRMVGNDVDRFVVSRLEGAGRDPLPLTTDLEFLRRLSLDTIGVIPSEALIEQFARLPDAVRRQAMIERLLDSPEWADHWVGYWQDVLAENPGMTKPELNNTGPFRWYLHEALLDNQPFDRFVTELIRMEGSRFRGGPAGFGLASQNDVPMAAKAHIVGTAFLAVEMKCARCHDAPYHDIRQQDLFSLAAMLERKPIAVPGTSSVPAAEDGTRSAYVSVSLQPGDKVSPAWPFPELASAVEEEVEEGGGAALPAELLRGSDDPREQLAAFITSPHNRRFAKVLVNRLWQRLLGHGLCEPVDDWEHADCSHPELLEFLARELLAHDYDVKHILRLILESQTYQRLPVAELPRDESGGPLFVGPQRRRMTGEQLVDSLYRAVGKSFGCEELTMDRDGKQDEERFGHFGVPQRAWEFVAVANERDRVSLNLPMAQSVIDMLAAYGWRQQRQEPLSVREAALTPLQPMALANGTAANRVVDLSDGAELTELCLEAQPMDVFVRRVFQRLMTRLPTRDEEDLFVRLLADGYDSRIIAGHEAVPPRRVYRSGITWSNHFDPKSDQEAVRRQREIVCGDPPTQRLAADWRERVEDMVWTLMNSPEFVFIP